MNEGQTVRLKQPVIQGDIKDTRFNKEVRQLEHLVEYGEDGETHTRWFLESQLEAV